MSFSIQWKDQGLYVGFNGRVLVEELHDYMSQVHGDYRYDELKYGIIDLRQADLLEIGIEDIEPVAARSLGASYTLATLKLAIVTADPHTRDCINHYREKVMNLSKWKIRIFASREEAREWVDNASY